MIADAREPAETLRGWPPYGLAFLAFVLSMVLSFAVVIAYVMVRIWEPGVPLAVLLERMGQTNPMSADVLMLSTSVTAIVLSACALIPAARGRRGDLTTGAFIRRRLRLFPTSIPDIFAASVGVLGLGLMLDVSVRGFGLQDEGSLASIRAALGSLSGNHLILAGIVIGVFPGVGEELFFRGYMLRRIERGEGALRALIASSIIFGLFHFDMIHSTTAALVGLYLGLMVLWSGSLWVGIIAHGINNFFAAVTVATEPTTELMILWFFVGLNAAATGLWYAWRRHGRIAGYPFW